MFTQCPDCGTVFRVTATVLRAARGQVRCGVCDATFDALQYLTEEVDADGTDDGGARRGGGSPGEATDGRAAAATGGTSAAAYARTGDTAEHERLVEAEDDGPVDASAIEDDEFHEDYGGRADDEDEDDDGEDDRELSDAETEERILEAAAQQDAAAAHRRRDEAFPLEELDDPIDVLAQPGSGPAPEFPPFAPESAAHDVPPEPLAAHRPVAPAPVHGTPPPAPEAPAFVARAGRTTPSVDEDRALAEIAAALARRAQASEDVLAPAARAPTAVAPAPPPAAVSPAAGRSDAASADDEFVDLDAVPSIEVDLLDPALAENIVLEGGDEIPESALEFDLPAEEWDRVFVPDADAPTIPPLDAELARARAEALREPPPREPTVASAPARRAVDDDEFELELDDDGDLDDHDLRERGLDAHGQLRTTAHDGRPPPATAAHGAVAQAVAAGLRPPAEDPLARTDEFPPLQVTLAEQAAAGLADTPDAKPRTGVTPEDFDALVAAAAARAAAEVAARVGAPAAVGTATIAATAATAAPAASVLAAAGSTAAAAATRDGRAPAAAPFRDPLAAAEDAEATWFDARRDLAPEGAPIAQVEPGELIHFDAQRFQAIARGGDRRPWWATTLLALGLVVLALALLAQAVHYWRDTLAQHPVVGPPLQDAYARLGLPLEPEWNLGAYEVKQWGATSDVTPGTLRVRASVVNRAPRAQPHPLLRVTLLDRFSGKVARREFRPAEYLPGRAAPTGLLAPGARVDADLVIADPGSEAVGFELDVCLVRRGALSCAGEQRLAAP